MLTTTRFPRSLAILVVAVVGLSALLIGPDVSVEGIEVAPLVQVDHADAAQYQAQYCRGTHDPGDWTVYSGNLGPNSGGDCALKVDFGANGSSGVWGTGTVGTFTWTAPDNTTIASWQPGLVFSVSAAASNTTGTWTLTYGPEGAGDQGCPQNSNCSNVVTPFAGATKISSRLQCVPLPNDTNGNCRQGAVMVDNGGIVNVEDDHAPTAGAAPSGSATTTKPGNPGRGTLSTSFSARDQGGGIKSVALEVDGNAVDTANGACQGLPSFHKVPCGLALDGTLSFDAGRVSDGAHKLSVVATDIAGNATTLYDGTTYIANKPVGPGSPAELRGDATSAGAVDNATVSASFPSTARRAPKACKRKSYKRRHKARCTSRRARGRFSGTWSKKGVLLTGRVANPANKQGIAGAPVVITGTNSRVSGTTTYHATTDGTGRYKVSIPRTDGSRNLTVGYRSHQFDEANSGGSTASTIIKARATLGASPRSVRHGKTIRFLGHSLDRTPGVPVLMQVYQRGKWRTFRTTSTRAKGAFRIAYGLKGIAPGRYRFRAQIRPTSKTAYAFAHGYSPSVRIRVR